MGFTDFGASSAGIKAVIDHPIHADAAIVLEQLGGDPSGFAARQLTPKIAWTSDLILTMTTRHRDHVLETCPQKMKMTFTLGEASRLASNFDAESIADLALLRPRLAAHEREEVPDPIGQGLDVFESIGFRIAELLRPIIKLCGPK